MGAGTHLFDMEGCAQGAEGRGVTRPAVENFLGERVSFGVRTMVRQWSRASRDW